MVGVDGVRQGRTTRRLSPLVDKTLGGRNTNSPRREGFKGGYGKAAKTTP